MFTKKKKILKRGECRSQDGTVFEEEGKTINEDNNNRGQLPQLFFSFLYRTPDTINEPETGSYLQCQLILWAMCCSCCGGGGG